jgi:hypothetical protein
MYMRYTRRPKLRRQRTHKYRGGINEKPINKTPFYISNADFHDKKI